MDDSLEGLSKLLREEREIEMNAEDIAAQAEAELREQLEAEVRAEIARLDDVLIAVEPGKAVVVVNNDLLALLLLEDFSLVLDAVHKDVAHRHEPGALIGGQRLFRRPCISSAAADHTDPNDVAAGREFIEAFIGWVVYSHHLYVSVTSAAGHGEKHGEKSGCGHH